SVVAQSSIASNGDFETPNIGQASSALYGGAPAGFAWTIAPSNTGIDVIHTLWTSALGAQSIDLNGVSALCACRAGHRATASRSLKACALPAAARSPPPQLGPSSITQTLSTNPGQSYTLSFYLSANNVCGDPSKQTQVWWGDTLVTTALSSSS